MDKVFVITRQNERRVLGDMLADRRKDNRTKIAELERFKSEAIDILKIVASGYGDTTIAKESAQRLLDRN
jgi:hypothetical protein